MRFAWKHAVLAVTLAVGAGAVLMVCSAGATYVPPGEFGGNFEGKFPWKYYPFTSEAESLKGVDDAQIYVNHLDGNITFTASLYLSGSMEPTNFWLPYCSGGEGRFHARTGDGSAVLYGTVKGSSPRRVLKFEGRVLGEGGMHEFKATLKEQEQVK